MKPNKKYYSLKKEDIECIEKGYAKVSMAHAHDRFNRQEVIGKVKRTGLLGETFIILFDKPLGEKSGHSFSIGAVSGELSGIYWIMLLEDESEESASEDKKDLDSLLEQVVKLTEISEKLLDRIEKLEKDSPRAGRRMILGVDSKSEPEDTFKELKVEDLLKEVLDNQFDVEYKVFSTIDKLDKLDELEDDTEVPTVHQEDKTITNLEAEVSELRTKVKDLYRNIGKLVDQLAECKRQIGEIS